MKGIQKQDSIKYILNGVAVYQWYYDYHAGYYSGTMIKKRIIYLGIKWWIVSKCTLQGWFLFS